MERTPPADLLPEELPVAVWRRELDVVLGGGSGFFLPSADKGKRTDGRNLIDEMKAEKASAMV